MEKAARSKQPPNLIFAGAHAPPRRIRDKNGKRMSAYVDIAQERCIFYWRIAKKLGSLRTPPAQISGR